MNNMNNMMMDNMYNIMMNNMNMPPLGNRINVVFKAITGVKYTLAVERGIKVSDMIKEYLARIDKESLFQNNSNVIEFIYQGKSIDIRNNNTKIEEFFGNRTQVEIQIVTNDLIGAQFSVILINL